jgi:ArsR family metal-binding transcriptional regulator
MAVETILAYLTALAALVALGIWGLKKYKQLNADGVITLDEIVDTVEEAKEKVAETKDKIDEALDKE